MKNANSNKNLTKIGAVLIRSVAPLVLILTVGCANLGPVSDGVTTQAALKAGAVEANPLLSGGDPIALAASIGLRHAYMQSQRERPNCTANVGFVNSFSMAAAGNNLLVAVAGAAPMVAIPAGIVMGFAHNQLNKERTEEWCYPDYPACNIADLPEGAAAARCVQGELVVTSWRLERGLASNTAGQ